MFFTVIARLTSTRLRFVPAIAAALFLGLTCGRGTAAVAVPWHGDLTTAQRASQASGRPVLAIFTASWMATAAAIDRTSLARAEAVAVVTACYEPVCVDVDAHPEATRAAGVTRVPTACVLTADGTLLAKFELPETPAEFVAAAARAAQDAAFASATSRSTPPGAAFEPSPGERTLTRLPSSGSAFGGSDPYATRPVTSGRAGGIVPPGGRAITAVAAKVRMLSDFANSDGPTTAEGDAVAASFREAASPEPSVNPRLAQTATQQTAAPERIPPAATTLTPPPAATTLASTAPQPATSAEAGPLAGATAAAAEAFAGSTTQSPLGIDPAPAAAPATTAGNAAPWLGLPPAAPAIAPPPSQPAETAVAAAPPVATKVIEPRQSAADAPTESAAPQPQTPPAGAASSLLATLQKPFTMFARPAASAKDDQGSPAKTSGSSEDVASAAPSEPDPYGPMPVGLEGYCPVMLAERGIWAEGRAQWGARHRGRTYLFAGEQQLKAFLADPDRYAPALSGDDPVLAFDAGKSTPGQRRYGVTYQSRMYLFSSPATRDAFAANPQRYTAGTLVAETRASGTADGSVVR